MRYKLFISKFFCIIINERLRNYVTEKNLIHPSQIGFQAGHRTANHRFTLKTLFDKHLNTNRNEKIYACFVDFKKAFYSVWHGGLFFKLLENKIDGPLYQLTKSLHVYKFKMCSQIIQFKNSFFPYSKGVRQGCILSPLLFNLYINELALLFDNCNLEPFFWAPIHPNLKQNLPSDNGLV